MMFSGGTMTHPCDHLHPSDEALFVSDAHGTDDVFRQFFHISDSLMFVVDEDLNVSLINDPAVLALGYGKDDIRRIPFLSLINENDREDVKKTLDMCATAAQKMDAVSFLTKDKKVIHVETRISKGTLRGKGMFFVSGKDISKLRISEEKFRKAFHSTSVLMVIFTVNEGRVLEVNEAACAMTGYASEEMIGRTIVDLDIYPEKQDRKKIRDLLRETGAVKNCDLKVRTRHGGECYGLFSMDVLEFEETLCVLAVGSDYTMRKKAEEALKWAFKEQGSQKKIIERKSRELEKAKKIIEEEARMVEESSRHKSEFLASMSHELRTPLNSIVLLADLLRQNRFGRLGEKELEYASVISDAAKDLLSLINDVLDISKVEAGRMEINVSRVSMEYLCRKITGYFNEMAYVKGLDFSVVPQVGLTDFLMTDVQKLEQIIKNLISNAIKFTEEGSVKLTIYRPGPETDLSMIGLRGLDPLRTIAFSVRDTGKGISDDKKDYVFEWFRQEGQGLQEISGGTGLGLSVSRVLAQLLGGDILLESQVMKGSTFTLYIPDISYGQSEKRQGPQEQAVAKRLFAGIEGKMGHLFSGKKILIADDDMRTVYSLIQNLEGLRAELLVAGDGLKCLKKLEENTDIALVLLDISMPAMDGFKVLERIRENEKTRAIPVVVITANAMKGDKEACLAAGADGYMPKPIDFEQLLEMMGKLAEDGRGQCC